MDDIATLLEMFVRLHAAEIKAIKEIGQRLGPLESARQTGSQKSSDLVDKLTQLLATVDESKETE